MTQPPHHIPSEGEDAQRSSLLRRLVEVLWSFLPLGWIAFGGPQAHIALLHEQFVVRRQWLDERRFAELLGLGQGLPGPTSTQMVVAVGTARAGPLGGLVALICFLYPAVAIMMLAGLGVAQFPADSRPAWLEGVQPGAVALVGGGCMEAGTVLGDHPVDHRADALGHCRRHSLEGAVDFSGRPGFRRLGDRGRPSEPGKGGHRRGVGQAPDYFGHIHLGRGGVARSYSSAC